MSQSFVKFYSHIVFHTKNNKNLIHEDIEDELYSYIGGILKNLKSFPIQIGGTTDHLHVLCTLPKTMTPADLVEEIKKSSSKWIKTKGKRYQNFYWQDGYGGFSVSHSHVEVIKNYILNQKQHHQRISFIEEYKKLLDEYGVDFDEKFL
jgi:REP element-mobilizing transposase RayT